MPEPIVRSGAAPSHDTAAHDTAALDTAAQTVSDLFARIRLTLSGWRESVLTAAGDRPNPAALDAAVAGLVLPGLQEPGALAVGAGFIAAPELTGGADVHFSWWLGPLEANPVYGATTTPTRLDLGTRAYTDYVRDFRALEWYRVPQSTHQTHVAGPYVDHLCSCDYIVTVTSPVEREGTMIGVVGVDVFVKRLEHELLPALLAIGTPSALVNADGRVLVATDPTVLPGAVVPHPERGTICAGTPFRLVATTTLVEVD